MFLSNHLGRRRLTEAWNRVSDKLNGFSAVGQLLRGAGAMTERLIRDREYNSHAKMHMNARVRK